MRVFVAIFAAALAFGVCEEASAQVECEELWREARQARASGNLVEARRLLEETMECAPSVSAAFNLAAVLRDMGRYSDARHYLLGLLDGQFGQLPAERRSIVEGEMERVEGSLGMLEVSVEPAAELRINGSGYGTFRGSRVLTLDPGEWSLELRAEGLQPLSEQIRLESGQRLRVRYELQPVVDGAETPPPQRALNVAAADEAPAPRPLFRRRLGIALAAVGAVAAALVIGFVVRGNNRPISDPFFGNPST